MQIKVLSEGRIAEALALWQEAGLTRAWNDPGADLRRALDGPASTVLAGVEEGASLRPRWWVTTATAAGCTTSP